MEMTKWNSVLAVPWGPGTVAPDRWRELWDLLPPHPGRAHNCLLYTSDAADE